MTVEPVGQVVSFQVIFISGPTVVFVAIQTLKQTVLISGDTSCCARRGRLVDSRLIVPTVLKCGQTLDFCMKANVNKLSKTVIRVRHKAIYTLVSYALQYKPHKIYHFICKPYLNVCICLYRLCWYLVLTISSYCQL